MSATYNKINVFVGDLANAGHNFGSNQLAVALTDTAPTSATTDGATFPGEISYANFSGANPNELLFTKYQ